MWVRYISHSWREVYFPVRIASWSVAMVASSNSKGAGSGEWGAGDAGRLRLARASPARAEEVTKSRRLKLEFMGSRLDPRGRVR